MGSKSYCQFFGLPLQHTYIYVLQQGLSFRAGPRGEVFFRLTEVAVLQRSMFKKGLGRKET